MTVLQHGRTFQLRSTACVPSCRVGREVCRSGRMVCFLTAQVPRCHPFAQTDLRSPPHSDVAACSAPIHHCMFVHLSQPDVHLGSWSITLLSCSPLGCAGTFLQWLACTHVALSTTFTSVMCVISKTWYHARLLSLALAEHPLPAKISEIKQEKTFYYTLTCHLHTRL